MPERFSLFLLLVLKGLGMTACDLLGKNFKLEILVRILSASLFLFYLLSLVKLLLLFWLICLKKFGKAFFENYIWDKSLAFVD